MVYHVGINLEKGSVAAYNQNKKETFTFEITPVKNEDEIEKIDLIFGEIKSRIQEELGYICICINPYFSNNFRKKIIDAEGELRCYKIQLLNRYASHYLSVIPFAEHKLILGDMIWILWKDDTCFIYEKDILSAKILKGAKYESDDFEKIKKDSGINKNPNLIIATKNCKVEITDAKKIFTLCKCVNVTQWSYRKAALLKARIMSVDPEALEYDIDIQLYRNIHVYLNKKIVLYFNDMEYLPLEKIAIIPIERNETNLNIVVKDIFEETISINEEMKSSGGIQLTCKIDENTIFTFSYCTWRPIDKISYQVKHLYLLNKRERKRKYDILPKLETTNFEINAIGIDLGTSRCCVAVNRRNGIETIPLDNTGERLLPSYVAYDEEKPKCGKEVVRRMQNYAKSTVFDSKRIIGKSFTKLNFDSTWPFEVADIVQSKPMLKVQSYNGPLKVYPEEVAAVLLKHMKQKIQEYQGKIPEHVVITVPAAFRRKQKVATHVAAELAGWEKIHLLPEPVAASIAYFIDRPIPDNSYFLLFDLGGGTLDVCIFQVLNKKFEIIGNAGDTNLGGRDFDELLIKYFEKALKTQYECDINATEKLKYRLMLKCMDIKHTLSTHDADTLDVGDFILDNENNIKITRVQFEEFSSSLLEKITTLIYKAFLDTPCTRSQISKILLAGGGCRMPMVKKLLQEMFPSAELCCEEHPDEVVAIGAAYYAYYLNSEKLYH